VGDFFDLTYSVFGVLVDFARD